jgi:5-methylcytosine-specific restriction enzyme subunit McrC
MLAKTFDIRISDGALDKFGSQRFDLLEIFISVFCEKLFAAVHRGLPRRYVKKAGDLTALRGRLDTNRQYTVLVGSPQFVACRYEDLSVDVPLNQIIKMAVRRLRGLSRSSKNRRLLHELEYAFVEVSSPRLTELLFQKVELDRTNAHWHDLFRLAKLLLGDRFQDTTSGNDTGFSLLFEMNTLFERYVGRVLKEALRGADLAVRLQGPRSFALFDLDASKPRFATRPDIAVLRGEEMLMILDAKWKRLRSSGDDAKLGVSQADVYQMIAYGEVYDAAQLLLLYPHHQGLGSPGIQATHRVAGSPERRLGIATVDLSDLSTVRQQLSTFVSA